MRLRTLFVGACLAAAVIPVLGRVLHTSQPAPGLVTGKQRLAWPTHFRGQPLTQLATTALEARFARSFPGQVARFTDGTQVLIVRNVHAPTRMLHPASDCFRATGYSVSAARAHVDGYEQRWSCFIAEKDGARVRVCERIEHIDAPPLTPTSLLGRENSATQSWTDVSAWYWHAQLHPQGQWRALTVVLPMEATQ